MIKLSRKVILALVFVGIAGLFGSVSSASPGGSTTLITELANGDSNASSVSDDGRYVAFDSYASNLDETIVDDNETSDVFVYDGETGKIKLISVSVERAGKSGNGISHEPSISSDGRFVAFTSSAEDRNRAGGTDQDPKQQ